MKTDIQIANETSLLPIGEVAENFGIDPDQLELYGKYKAKFADGYYESLSDKPDGKLVLVTAINPTPAGEGKSTTTVGLAQALCKLGKKAVVALREPSLGPCMGVKGGATGGGYSQVVPMEDINLHFTGDLHAMTTAHNLLSALIDNHIFQGNELGINPCDISWKRAMDMNDRSLRNTIVGLSGNGTPREDGFMITVASEIMAIVCLSSDLEDLKTRLNRIIIGYTYSKKPVSVADLQAGGAMAALLKDTIKPNLVQTLEHTPAIIHGGPFANIAHGCNSIRATRLALKLGEIVVTEAGFGADLGAEKFFDIKCRIGGFKPDAVVLVATVRALKYNGGIAKTELKEANTEAVLQGLPNLEKHIENLTAYGVPVVVALNTFDSDMDEEINAVRQRCHALGADFVKSDVWAKGGEGGIALAEAVIESIKKPGQFKFAYELELSIKAKIETIAKKIYGAGAVTYSAKAARVISRITKMGYSKLPVCMAKTQYSLSDNPALLGRPEGFTLNVADVRLSAGAGFVVALAGDIMTMPGLPKIPAANVIDIDANGTISGLF